MSELICTCSCGKARVVATGQPFARFICHCTICQSVYRSPFADPTVLWASSVPRAHIENVQLKKYRAPPALSRGTCISCGLPAVAYLTVAPLVRFAFIPAANYPQPTVLPAPAMHVFYHSRIADACDALPKYSGYFKSELAVTRLVIRSAFRRRLA